MCKAGFGYSNCHVEMARRGGVLHFLLCQRQLVLHTQAPLWPVLTGVVWCVLCRTREGHIALFALHTGLYPARIYFFYTGLVISKYALLLPMTNAHFISAAWKTGTASSSILYSSSRSSPCFIAAWGNLVSVGHPGSRAKRGHGKTRSLNTLHRSRRFGESFYSLQ